MKKFILIAAASLLCASCIQINSNFKGGKNAVKGEGPVITKDYDFRDFDALCVNGNADVVFIQDENWKVTLTTQENIPEYLDYKVENGILLIQAKNRRTIRAEEYSLEIHAPAIRSIEVNGAADVDIPSGIQSDEDIEIEVNGAGDLKLVGIACKTLSVEINGAADLKASGLDVATVNVEINGAGDAKLSGKAGEASLEVNGAGDIDARGLSIAGEVKKHTSGISKIQL